MGGQRKSAVISESRKLTAFHEAGHAFVAIGTLLVHRATNHSRGIFLGMVVQLPDKDERSSISRKQMLARLYDCMGGQAAEELIFGE